MRIERFNDSYTTKVNLYKHYNGKEVESKILTQEYVEDCFVNLAAYGDMVITLGVIRHVGHGWPSFEEYKDKPSNIFDNYAISSYKIEIKCIDNCELVGDGLDYHSDIDKYVKILTEIKSIKNRIGRSGFDIIFNIGNYINFEHNEEEVGPFTITCIIKDKSDKLQ